MDWENIKPFAIIGIAAVGLYLAWQWLSSGAAQQMFGGGGAGGGGGMEERAGEEKAGGGGAQIGTVPVSVQETKGEAPATTMQPIEPFVTAVKTSTVGATSTVGTLSNVYAALAPVIFTSPTGQVIGFQNPITQRSELWRGGAVQSGQLYMTTGKTVNPFTGKVI